MTRSASEIIAENEALEALLQDRLNSLTERMHAFTQQTNDLYAQTKQLADTMHDKYKRVYQIEDHLLRLQGKPGLSELYLENGSQPRRLTKELDELRMGVKTLRRKFQAATNVISTAGWWRHLKVDTDKANKDTPSSSATAIDTKNNDKPLSPALVASPVPLSPSTRSSRSTIPLNKIFTSPASPTSPSFVKPGSSTPLVSPRDGQEKGQYRLPLPSERANPSLGLRSPPLSPKTTSNPVFKGLLLPDAESKLHANLRSMHERDNDNSPPMVMMVTTDVDSGIDIPPLVSGRPGTGDEHSEPLIQSVALDSHLIPPSPVDTASEAEEEEDLVLQSAETASGTEPVSTEESASKQPLGQSHMGNGEQEDKSVDFTDEIKVVEIEKVTTSTSTTASLSSSSNNLLTSLASEADSDPSNEDDWEEVEDDSPAPQDNTQTVLNRQMSFEEHTSAHTVGKRSKRQEQLQPHDLGWIQRLWLLMVRVEYLLLGTAVLGAMLPDNFYAFCTGFVSAVAYAVVLIVKRVFNRGGDHNTRNRKPRDAFTYGRGSSSRYRASVTSTPNRSPASTISRRHR